MSFDKDCSSDIQDFPASGLEWQSLDTSPSSSAFEYMWNVGSIALGLKAVWDAKRSTGTYPSEVLTGWLTEKAIVAGPHMSVTSGTNTITVSADAGTANALLGDSFISVVSGSTTTQLYADAIVAGTNVVVSSGSNSVTIHSATPPAIIAGNNLTVTSGSNTTTVTVTGAVTNYGNQFIEGGSLDLRADSSDAGTTTTVNGASRDHRLFIHTDADFSIGMDSHQGNSPPGMRLYKSSGTHASPSATTSGLNLGVVASYAHDGTDYGQAARIRFFAKKTATSDNTPGYITLETTSEGTNTNSTRMQIDDDGVRLFGHSLRDINNVTAASGTYEKSLTISGSPVLSTASTVTFPDGSAGTPSIRFTNDPDTGIFLSTTNTVGISASGTEIVQVKGGPSSERGVFMQSGVIGINGGTTSSPGLQFQSGQTGLIQTGAGSTSRISVVTPNGTERVTISGGTGGKLGLGVQGDITSTGNITTYSGIDFGGNLRGNGNVSASGNATFHGNFEASKSSIQGGAGYTVLLDQSALVPVQVNLGDPAAPEFSLRIVKFGSSSLQFTNGDGSLVFFRFDSTSNFVPEFPLGATASGSPVRPRVREWLITGATASGTNSEVDLVKITIPGQEMGTTRSLRWELDGTYFNNTGNNRTFTLRVYYGGDVIYQDSTANLASNDSKQPWNITGRLTNVNSSQRQFMLSSVTMGRNSGGFGTTKGIGALDSTAPLLDAVIASSGTLSYNSSQSKEFKVSVQHNESSADLFMDLEAGRLWIDG